MKISYNWLKEYINIGLMPEKTAEILTSIGLEVESIEPFETVKGGLEGLVIGEVITCAKHPDADRLSVTTVNVGGGTVLPIVCGAPNVAQGQKVVVATVGTTLYKGNESFTIKKSKIRGEVSEGMICAEDEIGLGTSHEGIMVLDASSVPGTPAKDYFNISNDIVFEIGLTPNRIDAASHFGVARDLAAFLNQQQQVKLSKPNVDKFCVDNKNYHIDVIIENKEACPRYSGVTISGVTIKDSPEWLQNRLKAIGLTPINNVVDITNFVLHEAGQPLHAFDADKVTGKKVVIKTLREKTKFLTLDKVERELSSEDLMICNANEGMCIAGVFGGIDSGIHEGTKNIFLESAYFNPVYIRKTSKRHGLNTDASFRFERGADPNNTVYALKRAALLIKEIAGGTISSEVQDVYPNKIEDCTISISYSNVDRLIGKKIDRERLKGILKSLDINILKEIENGLQISIPTYRSDVKREADVIEEILRIYGYNNIELTDKVNSTITHAPKPDKEKLMNIVSDYLSNNGFFEIMSNSLTKSSYYKGLADFKEENVVQIANPLSSDLNGLRQTLLFGGLEAIIYNINRRNANIRLYEFGNCYSYHKNTNNANPLDNYREEDHLALFISGQKNEANWNTPAEPSSFFQMKMFVENILTRLGFNMDALEINEVENGTFSEGLSYSLKNMDMVSFGFVNKQLLAPFDIENIVFYADLHWKNVLQLVREHQVKYSELPKYPEVKRDLSLLLDKQVKFTDIKNLAYKAEKKLLRRINLFDVFEGEKIGKDKKSYAVSFILQDENKTLTDKEIDKIMSNLARVYETELGAQIR